MASNTEEPTHQVTVNPVGCEGFPGVECGMAGAHCRCMKALDLSHPSFHAPLKAQVTFKTMAAGNALTRRAGNGPEVQVRPSTAVAVAPVAARSVAQLARVRIECEVERLSTTRAAHVKQALGQTENRADDMVHDEGKLTDQAIRVMCRELINEFSLPVAPTPTVANSNALVERPLTADQAFERNEVRALHALRLIEKIDLFLKTQRPALALTLNDSIAARVEIERVGPKQVALRVVGRRGPPSPEAVTRIREEMEARGLKIAALSIS